MDSTVKLQYEIFPYPTSSFFWRPQMTSLLHANYEAGHALIHKKLESHREKKILLLGCGTNEPLIFALGHPHAEITAVDLSQKSLNSAKRKCLLRGIGNVQFLSEDLQNLNTTPQHHGQYDYIHCYGVLHHLPNPEQGFKNLSKLLSDNGFARIMVYSQASRFRISLLSNLLKTLGIDFTQKDFKKKALKVINSLPLNHPLRLTFETHTEVKSTSGLVDAFLHACERPLRFQELKTILKNSKLYIHQWDLSQNIKNLLSGAEGKTLEDKIYFLEKTSQWPTHFTFWVSKKPPQTEPSSISKKFQLEYVKNPLCKNLPYKFYSPLLKNGFLKTKLKILKSPALFFPSGHRGVFMNQNEQKQTLKITWLIKTFHQAGLDFLEIQSTEKWSAEKSKDVLSQISVPAAPTWMIKKRPQSVDQDLRIAAFDPALRIETTLEMIKNSEMSLNNDELFYSSPLSSEDLHQKLKMTHTPYLHTCVLESEFCNEQKNNDSFLLQSYFKLSPWKKLKFLELYWGLTKSHTTLEFQPIDFSSPNT